MSLTLKKHPRLAKPQGPVLVVIMDGVGLGPGDAYDAVARAHMPRLRALMGSRPGERSATDAARFTTLKAHGTAVGLPSDDDMGNSEVGHNALGSGRIVLQGATLVDSALATAAVFRGDGWQKLEAAGKTGTFHVIGLLSDGGVHSRLDQMLGILDGAVARGAKRIRFHALFDGRDVPDHSAQKYVDDLQRSFAAYAKQGVDARVASGGGRMNVTMDRYESDWSIVERGWRAHVLGDAPHKFLSVREALETLRAHNPGISDQQLPPFVIVNAKGRAVGTIEDGDAVLLANFRGDRAMQISRAFDDESFTAFDRVRWPKVAYAGLMEYDGDLHIPRHYLVSPPVIEETSGEYLAAMGMRTFACSETQKYGHVTYFWNGNRSGTFDEKLETHLEIPSNPPPFQARPEMKAREIADATIAAIASGKYDMLRVNFANGDMVGHTGLLEPTIKACEAVDVALGRLLDAIDAADGIAVVTADHGNADDMALRDKNGQPIVDAQGKVLARTSHTLAPVPFIVTGKGLSPSVRLRTNAVVEDAARPAAPLGLANVAATLITLLGFEAPQGYEPALIELS